MKELVNQPLSKRDSRYLDIAKSVALTSGCKNMHGAVITKSGRILGVSANRWRNTPSAMSQEHIKQCSYHAEVMAIKLSGDCSGGSIYVARMSRSEGIPMLSRPCNSCYDAIIRAGLRKVVYT